MIAQEAIEWYANHERKDLRNFKSRMALIVETFGERSRMRSSLQRLTGGSANMRECLLPRTGTRMSSARLTRLLLPMAE